MAHVGGGEEKRKPPQKMLAVGFVGTIYRRGLRLRSRSSSGQAERESGVVRVMAIP